MALNITVQSYDRSLDFGLMADGAAMPDVRELADAIAIAFDDLRALPQPGDAGHEETPDEGVVGRTTRKVASRLTGAAAGTVGRIARKVVSVAVDTAVAQVTRKKVVKPSPSLSIFGPFPDLVSR